MKISQMDLTTILCLTQKTREMKLLTKSINFLNRSKPLTLRLVVATLKLIRLLYRAWLAIQSRLITSLHRGILLGKRA